LANLTIDDLLGGMTDRLWSLVGVVALLCAVLLGRLWYEQVWLGDEHRDAIRRQSIRQIRVAPVRGRIHSRDGEILADNRPVHHVYFHLHEMRRPGSYQRQGTIDAALAASARLASLLQRENPVSEARLRRHLRVYPALPFKAFTDLNARELARVHELVPGIRGVEVSVASRRIYPQRDVAAHVLGFVGRRDPSTEENRDEYWYFLPEHVGRTGLERRFDEQLRGRGGKRLVRVDHAGLVHEELAAADAARMGADLMLTLDSRAQRLAQNLLSGQRGAMALVDVRDGSVLALASAPTYDLNRIGYLYGRLAQDEAGKPLLNRALAGGYMPGSIIKPLIGLAALQRGTVSARDRTDSPGYYQLGRHRIGCTAPPGRYTLAEALETSSNAVFMHLGMETGLDHLQPLLQRAGIGQDTGFSLHVGGDEGLLPDRADKRRRTGEPWYAADTAFISMGQGQITLSPLQAAMYTAAIANGGTLYEPQIVAEIRGPQGEVLRELQPHVRNRLAVAEPHLQEVRRGMHMVVHGDYATGGAARTPVIELAGKTGTAEVRARGRSKNTWFVCFGPYEDPQYALAILVEDGQSGGRTCAPLARRFFEKWLTEGPAAMAATPRRSSTATLPGG